MKRFGLLMAAAVLLSAAVSCKSSQKPEKELFVRDTASYAAGLDISGGGDVVKVQVRDPWDTLVVRRTYWLVRREAASDSLCSRLGATGVVVKVPVERAVVYTSVHAAMAEQLGVVEKVRGVCESQYMTSQVIRQRIADGLISDYGSSTTPNVEKIIEDRTDVIIASPFENSSYGAAEKLGIPIVEAADYMERHPLGRTTWVRFLGLLFGVGDRAEEMLAQVVSNYNGLKALAASVPVQERPTVMLERKYGQAWFVPSQSSYIGTFHKDAAARYIFSDVDDTDSRPMQFEEVLKRAENAQFWFLKYTAERPMTYDDLKQEYAPYANFAPFKNRRIYACNTLESTYYDDITLRPDRILADFIKIYHPSLLPDHQPVYYFPLSE
ncbi:MAG: ABC transporter substrate-binding protein [Bacteroidales bacterium]|nr:ABC transporter substrate-binding protein [Candidatus Equibacterium intestinale]